MPRDIHDVFGDIENELTAARKLAEGKDGEIQDLESRVSDLKDELHDANSEIDRLRSEVDNLSKQLEDV